MKTENNIIIEPARETPVYKETDVLVVGGGPAGIMAALAAAESGRRVVLAESRSHVGGNLTLGLPILGFLSQKKELIIKGLPQKLMERLKAKGAASDHQPCPLHVSLTIVDPEVIKTEAMAMLLEAGVEILLHTMFADAIVEDGKIKGCIFQGKGRREAILAGQVVDCTGDGDVAFQAGAPCEKGDAGGGMQPPTLMFRLDNVDTDKLRKSIAGQPGVYQMDFIPPDYFGQNSRFITVGLRNLIEKARADGVKVPTDRTIIITGIRKGEAWINMTRVKEIDGSDSHSLTDGEIIARQQIDGIVKYLTGYVPGFENAWFSMTSPFLGIRESRRVVGQYMLNRDDLLSCGKFADAVAVGSYPIDIHRPNDNDCTLEWCGDCYDIPYRSLVPQKIENLLIAGRCIGTTHEAMAATRVMSTCMAIGEAAGRAAAMCAADGITPAALDVKKLREALRASGAYLRS
ncbi:FAD-dependent oxidoreductase [Termitidicoccus mucosus]|uniref:FAD-binding protein n=1 Tax=Termitidicoccus mucosus TaxID=1184151 RepID=A0A178IKL8_9BACT|nr:FAD-binding protein [Opitutaceae bacterium TSB47]